MSSETSQRLIKSTQDLLWERGFVGTSPRAIQARAQAGQGSMYHHFHGKSDLALAAMRRSAEELRAEAEAQLSGSGTALERIAAYLQRERDVLRGCRIGRLAQDPEVIADPQLREPVDETLRWLTERLTQVLAEGQADQELHADFAAADVAATLAAVIQGAYVLSRAAQSVEPFDHAVRGALELLSARALAGDRAGGVRPSRRR